MTKNGAVTGTFAYGGANHDRLSSFNGKTVTYDANGNPLSYDGYTYSWQRGSQLSGISGNGKTVSYVYDLQGRRVQKTVDGITTTYVYSGDMLISQSDGTNTLGFAYDSQGMAIGFKYGGNYYYYMRDLLGNVTAVADTDGNLVAEYSYDAYGNLLSSSGALANINPIRYRGYYYDSETSFYYLKTRYYNPQWRRFINADSLFIAGDIITGCNMYAYCEDNPIMNTDSTGTSEGSYSNKGYSYHGKGWEIYIRTDTYDGSVEGKKYNYSIPLGGYISNTKDPDMVGMTYLSLFDKINFNEEGIYIISHT